MSPKPGTKVSLVPPAAVKAALEAANAEAGATAAFQWQPKQASAGQFGSVEVGAGSGDAAAGGGSGSSAASSETAPPHHPPETQEEKAAKPSWIEIELVGEDDKPIPGARYRVMLPDGSVDEGSLDGDGFARVEGFVAGTCKVCFPELDEEAWEFIESVGARGAKVS
jgi:hypothetical protein